MNRTDHPNQKIDIESEKYPASTQFFITFVVDKIILLKMLSHTIKPMNNTIG
uniref:hypothetical protein n=1 Tax=Daejeonella sp. TaxID=2805397 RepID=UPI0040492D12